jgi:hypothetical protein
METGILLEIPAGIATDIRGYSTVGKLPLVNASLREYSPVSTLAGR